VIADTAKRAVVYGLIVGGLVVLALALWKLRALIALLFLGIIIAAAMRPGVEWLWRKRVPRAAAIGAHYVAFAGLVALLVWLVVPRAIDQVENAIGEVPTRPEHLNEEVRESTGIKHDLLVSLQKRLEDVRSGGEELIGLSVEIGFTAFEIAVGIFFVLATAAYWIYEREKAVDTVCQLLPRPRRKRVRDTWHLIDLKLGAYVRGQGLLILLVATVLSLAFWAIGLPYWILVGIFAGVVEIVPVIGPLAAGALAIGVGLTESVQLGLWAGLVVLGVRLVEDYLVIPRVLGEAVGLSPLLVLFSITGAAILFGEFAVLLAIPLAAVIGTLFEVILLDRDPAEEDVPTVLFPAQDAETQA
jgi:predicted PurR-regulated permease PerM